MGFINRVPQRLNLWELDATGVYLNELCIHAGDLYGLDRTNKKLYRWDDLETWTEVASTAQAVTHMCSFNGNLYVCGGTNGAGKLMRFDGSDLPVIHTQAGGTGGGGLWNASGQLFNFDDTYLFWTEGYTGNTTVGYVYMDVGETCTYGTYAQSGAYYPQGAQVSPIYNSRRVTSDGSLYRSGSNLLWQAPGSGSLPGLTPLIAIFADVFYALDYRLWTRSSFAGAWGYTKTPSSAGHCLATAAEVWAVSTDDSGYFRAFRTDGTKWFKDQTLGGAGSARWIAEHNDYLVVPSSTGKIWRRPV